MYPEIHLGPLTLYSYGLMLGIAFLIANSLLTRELKRLGRNADQAFSITFLALVGGVVGARLFHVLENFSQFLIDPIGVAFTSGGLTWYGGFLLAATLIAWYLRKKRIPFLFFADITAPGMALAYGIARIGCQLAGDGDYGIPTNLPWAMSYENGTVPTAYTLGADGTRIPTEWVHPTPLYELGMAIPVFLFLYLRRTRSLPPGNQFGWFLILHSLSRFLVEFIRINPDLIYGLSEAQIISLLLIGWGVYLVRRSAPVVSAS